MDLAQLRRAVTRTWLPLVALVVALVPGMVQAAVCTQYRVGALSSVADYDAWHATKEAACQRVVDYANSLNNQWSYSLNGVDPSGGFEHGRCSIKATVRATGVPQANPDFHVIAARTGNYCSDCEHLAAQPVVPEEEGGYSCSRVEGHVSCVARVSSQPVSDANSQPICSQSAPDAWCLANGERTMYAEADGGWSVWTRDPRYIGVSCLPPEEPPPPQLPEGKCPGEVNGRVVVVNCASTSTLKDTTVTHTTSTPDGTATSTVTTSANTTCTGDKCTTTTTKKTTDGDGEKTETEEKTESRSDYCKENPNSKQCTEDNTQFSGSCSGKFQCTGGAAECAIARAINEANCQLTPSAGIAEVASALEAGTFGPALPETAKNVGEFDTANPLSSGCPGDHQLTIGGTSITVPLAGICSELQMMGNVFVAFTLLAATLFVIRGVS